VSERSEVDLPDKTRIDEETRVFLLDDIPFAANIEKLRKQCRVREEDTGDFERLVEEAVSVARPKALYRLAYVDALDEDLIAVDGTRLKSRVLKVNLENVHRVFPFVLTCGREIEEWAWSLPDLVHRFWADALKIAALRQAGLAMQDHLDRRFLPGPTSVMSPGSLKDWPIEEQRSLFTILGEEAGRIGVTITPQLMMVPAHSVSGIRFPSESRFESCQLCPREECPGRRAAYDRTLYERRYALGRGVSA
jgi:hypothetical protein